MWDIGGLGGGFCVVREEMSAKWSDGDEGRATTVGDRGESIAVIRRSSMLPSLWVGKVTCCSKLKSDRIDMNCAT